MNYSLTETAEQFTWKRKGKKSVRKEKNEIYFEIEDPDEIRSDFF